ncbi:MAG: type VII toxin-antitoxin system MntA family adenylyltransferase antitoxin, partial [Nitrososphaeria archaeon]
HSWTEVWIPDYGWLTVDPKILNQLRSEEIEALKRVFEEHDVGIAYLFGSRVKGTSREDSDFDVAALFEKDVTVMDEIRLAMDIVSALNVSSEKVDVVSLNKADDTLKARVLREGIPVYARSEKSRKEWERQTYLEVLNYMDLLAIYKISRENNTLH